MRKKSLELDEFISQIKERQKELLEDVEVSKNPFANYKYFHYETGLVHNMKPDELIEYFDENIKCLGLTIRALKDESRPIFAQMVLLMLHQMSIGKVKFDHSLLWDDDYPSKEPAQIMADYKGLPGGDETPEVDIEQSKPIDPRSINFFTKIFKRASFTVEDIAKTAFDKFGDKKEFLASYDDNLEAARCVIEDAKHGNLEGFTVVEKNGKMKICKVGI